MSACENTLSNLNSAHFLSTHAARNFNIFYISSMTVPASIISACFLIFLRNACYFSLFYEICWNDGPVFVEKEAMFAYAVSDLEMSWSLFSHTFYTLSFKVCSGACKYHHQFNIHFTLPHSFQ